MFHYQVTVEDTKSVLSLNGDLDIDAFETVKEEIMTEQYSTQHVEIDFSRVRFVDSTGIGLLIDLVHHLRNGGKAITIANVSREVQEVFSLLQLADILGKDVFI
ncbi:STAS domain-containing protein [Brevibacillus sp. SYP-B805]|uniref:STAS domain-containing protein n=1 Tax=Brevibacillus sp. SYP-B805 TaxID=1578199 RepID=UPI0013ECBDD7|nr:STAS domain-containing protein [Brevibacillus sp. SYP-B805]NGQ94901.1 STAS domain-containing protein [Brevibacillus sp. SYP-B805]